MIDAASADGTAAVAERAGANVVVYQEDELMPELGPVLGKGDAMWRALSVLEGRSSAIWTPTRLASARTSPRA